MTLPSPSPDLTGLLQAWSAGDSQAAERVASLVYQELRRQARLALRREAEGHTLQVTGLVHEAWLRLDAQHDSAWESRNQFFAVAARMMRRVLVDHARSRHAAKRGGAAAPITLSAIDREGAAPGAGLGRESAVDEVDLLALDDALTRLAAMDPRKAKLVELRYFAGLSMPEVADALGVSQATVGREWAVARMWLRRELAE